ncbi:recombination protein RecR [Candidatus Kaiserbacteria bacterium]|nr:recombination protein RecR [Candidatus Kaiserbacteria bacterium]NCT01763.1 recombination protein RecR [Candidatus Parcubacteria bacterium]
MNTLDKLIQLFEQFPGVGARQAKRFAFHILTMNNDDSTELSQLIANLKGSVVECGSCHRFYATKSGNTCSICASPNRDHERILIVERDSDVQAIERAGVYDGLYFVLGGTVPLLNTIDNNRLRAGALKATIETRIPLGLSEIIFGFSVNPDGENTARFVESIIKPLIAETSVQLSYLGRGLSTGSELEYADPETIKNALKNRHQQ